MTPRLEDFISPPRLVIINPIKGIAGSLQPCDIGTVRYIFKDDTGRDIPISIPDVLYCPDIPITLISPQCLCKTEGNSHTSKFAVAESKYYLHVLDRCITIYYGKHRYSNLPTIQANMATDKFANLNCQTCYNDTSNTKKTAFYNKNLMHLFNTSITHDIDMNLNLTSGQQELLLLHRRYGQIDIRVIQSMCTKGAFGPKYTYLRQFKNTNTRM